VSIMSDVPPVTRALVIANIVMFGLQQLFGEQMLLNLALWPLGEGHPLRLQGGALALAQFEPWQLITYAFLHGSVGHVAFNMLGLWSVGTPIERLLGARAYLFYYFVCVLGAAAAQLLIVAYVSHEFVPTLGASGGVFGVMLAFGMIYPHQKLMLAFIPFPISAWLFVILYATIELFSGVLKFQPGVAHFAHLGGMLAGIVLILYWRGQLPIKPKRVLIR
jgi:membrane associated rhomboid family serine protease